MTIAPSDFPAVAASYYREESETLEEEEREEEEVLPPDYSELEHLQVVNLKKRIIYIKDLKDTRWQSERRNSSDNDQTSRTPQPSSPSPRIAYSPPVRPPNRPSTTAAAVRPPTRPAPRPPTRPPSRQQQANRGRRESLVDTRPVTTQYSFRYGIILFAHSSEEITSFRILDDNDPNRPPPVLRHPDLSRLRGRRPGEDFRRTSQRST